ncbi:MAG: hypothetical protein ABIH26_09405, partial [Candidatus Eisenbacteria bacterium]
EEYRVAAAMRGRLALLLSRRGDPARMEEGLDRAAEALRSDFRTEAAEDLLRLLLRGGRAAEIAGIALREGEIRNRASRLEGGPVLADRGRYIFMELLRDAGLDFEEIRRLVDRHAPRTRSERRNVER